VTAPLVLSASSIQTFLRCGRQWYYAYVPEYRMPPSVRQTIGIAAHGAIEVNMHQKVVVGTDLPAADVLDAFSTQYDTLVAEVEDPEEDIAKAKDSGIALVDLHHRDVAPNIQPILVEQPIQFEVNGVPYSGVVDLVDDRGQVRDWKTTSRRPQPGAYLLNMVGYAIGYREQTGETESDVVLDYLVRTKQPQYIPIKSGGPVSDDAIVRFADVVTDVAAAIQAGNFVPNGLTNGACSWCGYKSICKAYQLQNAMV